MVKNIVIGAGSCGTATVYILDQILGQPVYYYDKDSSKKLWYGKQLASLDYKDLEQLLTDEEDYFVWHICVPEQFVHAVVVDIVQAFDARQIMIHSTMPFGTTRKLAEDVAKISTMADITYNPLFFRDREIEEDVNNARRIVIGLGDDIYISRYVMDYALCWKEKTEYSISQIVFVKYEDAELIKLGTNALRATVISFFNQLAPYMKDKATVLKLLKPEAVLGYYEGGDWGTNPKLLGKAYGGKCLPKDVAHLSEMFRINTEAETDTFAVNMFIATKLVNDDVSNSNANASGPQ